MYICVCQAVTDRQIYQAAKDGAKTLNDLRRDLQVGADCGLCARHARECLKKDRHAKVQELLPASA